MHVGIDVGHQQGGGAPIKNKGVQVHHFVKGMKPHVTTHTNAAAAHEHVHSMVNHGEMAEIHNNGVHVASVSNVNGKMIHRVHGV